MAALDRSAVGPAPGPPGRHTIRRVGRMCALLLLPTLFLAASRAAHAQSAPRGDAPQDTLVQPADAADALSRARSAQQRFERLRRRWLPVTRGSMGSACDEIVGRVCLTQDDGDDWWPVPEDPRITQAREELLDELEAAGVDGPADPWILGQRVIYLGEAGRWDEAGALAGSCGTTDRAWCQSLLGLTLHARGRFRDAEAAFRQALTAMDERARRSWTDPTVLLDGAGRRWLKEAREDGAEAHDRALERLWSLADPLYLVDGNDHLTEHWARWTIAATRPGARSPHGLSWGRDLEELLLRYGSEAGWERSAPSPGELERVAWNHHPESRAYIPAGKVLEDPGSVEAGSWRLQGPRPRNGYAPPYAPVIIPAEGEILVFPRADRAWILATFALPRDTTWHTGHDHPAFQASAPWQGSALQAGLFLLPLDGGDPVEVRAEGTATGTLALEVPFGEYVVSLEVWSPEQGLAGRLRHGLSLAKNPADVLSLSHLALLEEPLPPSATLEDAAPLLRRSTDVRSGETIVVGWEIHGAGWRPSEPLSYRLSVSRVETGLLRRVGGWLGLVGEGDPQRLTWEERGPDRPGPVFRTVSMQLPDLEQGSYLVRLELATAGRTTLVSERRVTVDR